MTCKRISLALSFLSLSVVLAFNACGTSVNIFGTANGTSTVGNPLRSAAQLVATMCQKIESGHPALGDNTCQTGVEAEKVSANFGVPNGWLNPMKILVVVDSTTNLNPVAAAYNQCIADIAALDPQSAPVQAAYNTSQADPFSAVGGMIPQATTSCAGIYVHTQLNFPLQQGVAGAATAGGSNVDSAGNTYAVGTTTGILSTATLFGVHGASDFFASKFDPSGNLVWSVQIGTSGLAGDQYGQGLDSNGNVYITGYITGGTLLNAKLIGGTTGGVTAHNSFLIKIDTNGNILWVDQIGNNSGNSEAYGIAFDSSGNVALTGYTFGTIAAPSSTMVAGTQNSYRNQYIAILNSANGSIISTTGLGAANAAQTSPNYNNSIWPSGGLLVDAPASFKGNANAATPGSGYVSIGAVAIQSGSGANGQVPVATQFPALPALKNGSHVNCATWVAPQWKPCTAPVPAAHTVPSERMPGGGGGDLLISKFDLNGNFLWASQFGNGSMIVPNATMQDQGLCYLVAGSVNGVISEAAGMYGTTGTTTGGGTDAFLTKIEPEGDYDWSVQIGAGAGTLTQASSVVQVPSTTATGDMLVSGTTTGILPGAKMYGTHGTVDTFIARFNTAGVLQSITQWGIAGASLKGSIQTINATNFGIFGTSDVSLGGTQYGTFGSSNIFLINTLDLSGAFPTINP